MKMLHVCTALAVALAPSASRADELATAAFGSAATTATELGDVVLAGEVGKFVLPAEPALPVMAQSREFSDRRSENIPALSLGGSGGTPPPVSIPASSGRIVYFGLEMQTEWTAPAGNGATKTFVAGASLGLDLAHGVPTPQLQTWSASSGSVDDRDPLPASASNSTAGTIGDGRISGVAQMIQLAGNGNAVTNEATVDVSHVKPSFVVTTPSGSGPCGSACIVSVGKNFGVRITLPGGTVSQSFGPQGIAQQAQVHSDFNTIVNQLGIHIQTQATPSALISGSALAALQSLLPPGLGR
jgi:hypothetical protein